MCHSIHVPLGTKPNQARTQVVFFHESVGWLPFGFGWISLNKPEQCDDPSLPAPGSEKTTTQRCHGCKWTYYASFCRLLVSIS